MTGTRPGEDSTEAAHLTDEALGADVERAIAWAIARAGSLDYALRCLAFVEDAYERPNDIEMFGGSSATESAGLYDARSSTGEPPRGALVFFDCGGPVEGEVRDWGHVGLALGDGRMVHAWGRVRVDPIADAPELPVLEGWTPPAYIGWAGPRRILRGAIERSWDRT